MSNWVFGNEGLKTTDNPDNTLDSGSVEDNGKVSAEMSETSAGAKDASLEVLEAVGPVMANPYVVVAALSILLEETTGGEMKIGELELGESSPYTTAELESLLESLADFPNLEGKSQKGGVDTINAFLKEKGHSIKLNNIGPDDIAVAVVNTIEVEYKDPGEKIENHKLADGTEVVGASLSNVRVFDAEKSFTGNEIVYVPVANGGYMAISQMNEGISEGKLWDNVKSFTEAQNGVVDLSTKNGKVAFPMIDMTLQRELDYLLGVKVGNDFVISQALAESQLKVNHKKAISKTAAAVAAPRGIIKEKFVNIDGNFVLWSVSDKGLPADPYLITKEGMGEPEMDNDGNNEKLLDGDIKEDSGMGNSFTTLSTDRGGLNHVFSSNTDGERRLLIVNEATDTELEYNVVELDGGKSKVGFMIDGDRIKTEKGGNLYLNDEYNLIKLRRRNNGLQIIINPIEGDEITYKIERKGAYYSIIK